MLEVNAKIGVQRVQFTPSYYRSSYDQYRNGYYRDLIAMMKESAVDSFIAGCLMGRYAGFQRDWSIQPFEDDNSADLERAEFLRSMIEALDTRLFFKKIAEALFYKFSVIDFEWDIIDNKQAVIDFAYFDQKYFRYDPKDGKLKIDFGKRLEEIPPEALVSETKETPVMLPVLPMYILKNFGVESWAGFIETFGEGIIIGYYPPGMDASLKSELETAVNAIARSSRGTAPVGSEIKIIETQRSTGDHAKFAEYCDRGASISILGHANAVIESPGMKIGENLAPWKVRRELALDDISYIQRQMNRFLRTVYGKNWADARYPQFSIDQSEPINVQERLNILDLAWQQGVIINPDHWAELGLKIYEEQQPLAKEANPFDLQEEGTI